LLVKISGVLTHVKRPWVTAAACGRDHPLHYAGGYEGIPHCLRDTRQDLPCTSAENPTP
jgi:hypothetical protein